MLFFVFCDPCILAGRIQKKSQMVEKIVSRSSLPRGTTDTWRALPPLNIPPVLNSHNIHENEKYSKRCHHRRYFAPEIY